MGDTTALNQSCSQLKSNYSKTQLKAVEEALRATPIDDEQTAKVVCTLLPSLRVVDAARLLSFKWPEIPDDLRYVFQRLEWCGCNPQREFQGALALAVFLAGTDPQSRDVFIDQVLSRYKERPADRSDVVEAIRRSLLSCSGDPPQVALQMLLPEHIRIEWRWQLAKLLVDAVSEAATQPGGDKRAKLAPQARAAVVFWLNTLADSSSAASDRDALLEQRNRLTGAAGGARIPPVSTPSSNDPVSDPLEPQPDLSAQQESPKPDASIASKMSAAIKLLQDVWKGAQRELDRSESQGPTRQLQREVSAGREKVMQLEVSVGQLTRQLEQASNALHEREAVLRLCSEQLRESQEQLGATAAKLTQTESELARVVDQSAKLEKIQMEMKDAHVRNLDLERVAERRIMGEQIARAIADDLQTLQEAALHADEAGKAKLVLAVVRDMVQRLRQQGVPISQKLL